MLYGVKTAPHFHAPCLRADNAVLVACAEVPQGFVALGGHGPRKGEFGEIAPALCRMKTVDGFWHLYADGADKAHAHGADGRARDGVAFQRRHGGVKGQTSALPPDGEVASGDVFGFGGARDTEACMEAQQTVWRDAKMRFHHMSDVVNEVHSLPRRSVSVNVYSMAYIACDVGSTPFLPGVAKRPSFQTLANVLRISIMDIRRLEAFSKVYECRSFSRAGQELFLSQPTISAHVSALEEELGVRLFDRMGRVVLPTQAAEILYTHAQQVFTCLEQARTEILLVQDRVAGNLTVGGSTIPAHFVLPSVFAGFAASHPDVRLHLSVGDTRDIIAGISSGEYLLGMVGAKAPAPDVRFERILDDELIVIAPPGRFGLSGRTVRLAEVLEVPWVMREQGSGTRRALEGALMQRDVDLRSMQVAVAVESTQSVLHYVQAGLGVSVTSRLAAGSMLERGELVEVQVPELRIERSFYLAYNDRRHLFPASRYFMEYLRERCRAGIGGVRQGA